MNKMSIYDLLYIFNFFYKFIRYITHLYKNLNSLFNGINDIYLSDKLRKIIINTKNLTVINIDFMIYIII
jgi:hypothetical protein